MSSEPHWTEAFGPWLAPVFELLGSPVTGLELLAFALSLAMVWGNLRVRVWAWPLAMLASAAYGVLFASARLYGEASLQVFFIAVSAWGWWQWLRGQGDDGSSLRVRRLPPRHRWRATAATLLAWPVLGLLLWRVTDSDVPFADAWPTVASVTGQILLGRKYLENWLVWLVVNLFSMGLFAYKGLWLTVLLYGLFAVLSVVGWRAWRQLCDEPSSAQAAHRG
jgi:nicotinamide mononucleotide transporter